jgi:biofilm PGA synthesis N-glycosyltransferase PgaC
MQSLEYDRSFLAARILLDKINANMIISGAFGLFEKKTVIAVGGYDNSTMGEDMELVVRLHEFSRMNRKPYRIRFAQDAICWSQTPEKLSELCKQRKRWQRGLFQCMWGHHKMLANPRYGAVGLLSYLYFLLYELLSPFIELLGVLTMVLSVMMDMLNVKFMLVFLAYYALYGILLTLTAYFSRIYTIDQRLSFRELILAIIACFFETTFLRFYLLFVRVTAFVGYKKNKLNWGKLERKKMNRI